MFIATVRLLLAVTLSLLLVAGHLVPHETAHAAPTIVNSDEAAAALKQGKRLLQRNKADQAFNQLQTALKLFTQAGDRLRAAATEDALGDVYTQSGQYQVAITHYQSALEAFRRANDVANVNAMLAKMGEHYFLLGDTTQARAAFAAMKVTRPEEAAREFGAVPHGQRVAAAEENQPTGGAVIKVGAGAAAAALASIATCLVPRGGRAGNSGSDATGANNDPANPPNMGRAPRTPNGVGRMDLRVTDAAGKPLKGVQAQIKSTRPGGLYCECFETTTEFGRAVMPPLHIAAKIVLVLKAPGMAKQEIPLKAEDLADPVRVVMSKEGARVVDVAPQVAASIVANPCFDFYRFLIAFSTSELGMARADYDSNRLAEARARYEALLAQLALPGLEHLGQVPRFRTAARTALGDIAFREERFGDAIKLYSEARDGAQADNRLDLMWPALRGIGRSLWQQALRETNTERGARLRSEAMSAYGEALKKIEVMRAGSLRADEARTTFLATTKEVYDEAAAMRLELALIAAGAPAGAAAEPKNAAIPVTGYALTLASAGFATHEQGRARSLLEMLGEAQAGITEGVPGDLLQRRNDIAARQQEIMEMLTGVTLPSDKPRASLAELEAELDRLSIQYDGLENTIRTSSPRYAALTAPRPLGLSEVQQKVLDDKTALLVYSLGAERSYLWVITPDAVAVHRLPARADIETQVLHLRARLIPGKLRGSNAGIDTAAAGAAANSSSTNTAAGPGAYARAAHDLYRTIVAPAAALIESKRLLIVADGALNYVPFEALVTTAPAPDAKMNYAALDYLVKTNEVVYTPSASVIAVVREQARQIRRTAPASGGAAGSRGSMLIVADPVFSPQDVRVRARGGGAAPAAAVAVAAAAPPGAAARGLTLDSAISDVTGAPPPQAGVKLARLSGTRIEANEIAQLARAAQGTADVWLDFDASETNVVTRDMSRYRVLHFATHGLLNAARPQFTGLVLSLVGETNEDGFLRTNEIFNFRLGAPLVMLSACETGLGREKRGEGVIGLTRAFMYAGAPLVGVSLWPVSDRSTVQLMSDFYRGLLAESAPSPSRALREAQLKMITGDRYSAPFYWAPFVLIGDWQS